MISNPLQLQLSLYYFVWQRKVFNMAKIMKVMDVIVQHPAFVICSALWMYADIALDILNVLNYYELCKEVSLD